MHKIGEITKVTEKQVYIYRKVNYIVWSNCNFNRLLRYSYYCS